MSGGKNNTWFWGFFGVGGWGKAVGGKSVFYYLKNLLMQTICTCQISSEAPPGGDAEAKNRNAQVCSKLLNKTFFLQKNIHFKKAAPFAPAWSGARCPASASLETP